jgi:hypothetical protein
MHKFKVGQMLEVIPAARTTMRPGPCRVVATLPFEGIHHQYRIKSVNEPTERIVNENDLRPGSDINADLKAEPLIDLAIPNRRRDREPRRRGRWEKPVSIRRGDVTHQVTSATQAVSMLLDADWPDTEFARAARKACFTAMENGSSEKAREAFAAAAQEFEGRSGSAG